MEIVTTAYSKTILLTCNLSKASKAASQGSGSARDLGTSYVLDADAAECTELPELADALEVAEVRLPVPLQAESALAGRGARGASYQSVSGRGQSYVPMRCTGIGALGTS